MKAVGITNEQMIPRVAAAGSGKDLYCAPVAVDFMEASPSKQHDPCFAIIGVAAPQSRRLSSRAP